MLVLKLVFAGVKLVGFLFSALLSGLMSVKMTDLEQPSSPEVPPYQNPASAYFAGPGHRD
jgi:hypothetical protein